MTCKVDIYANWKSSSFPCVFLFCVGSLLLGFDGTAENRSVWTAAGRDVAHTVGRKILERQQRLGERSNNAWAKFDFSPNKAARSSGPHK